MDERLAIRTIQDEVERNGRIMVLKTSKAHYTEMEAAEALGVSTDQLRALIRVHIADEDTDLKNVSMATFQPSDLLLLKILANRLSPSIAGD